MSAKKGGKKHKKVPQKNEIRPMPSLVYNNIRMTNEIEEEKVEEKNEPKEIEKESSEIPAVEQPTIAQTNIREKFIKEQRSHNNKMTFWLYVGMIVLLIAIIFFWGFSFWTNISSFSWKKAPESKIIATSQSDINQIFQTEKQNILQNQLTKIQIKETINKILQKANTTVASITSTTSTINVTPTSTTSTLITTSTIVTTTKK